MNLPGGMTAGRVLFPRLAYDVSKDFAYVTLVAAGTYVLVAHPEVPANSVSELVALARSKPEQLRYGSSGIASPPHLAFELFKLRTGTKVLHVPYKGAGPLVASLIGGEVQLGFVSAAGASALVKAGRLKALAVSSAKRAKSLPDLPTIAESGVPGYDYSSWVGMLAPARTPGAIVSRLWKETAKAAREPEMKRILAQEAAEAVGNSPEQFAAIIRREIATWKKVVQAAGIKAD